MMNTQKKMIVCARIWALCAVLCMAAIAGSAGGQTEETGDYVHYRLGIKYKNENMLDQAIEEFRKALAAYPDNYNAYMHIAEIREKQGQNRLAIYNLKKALAYNPGWGKAHIALARVYEADQQFENAIKELQLYQQVCDPEERPDIQEKLNGLTARMGAGQGGATAPAQSAESSPNGHEKPSAAAKKAGKAGQSVRSPAVKQHVSAPEAEREFKLGVQAYKNATEGGDTAGYEKALEHFRACLSNQPGHTGAYYYAGMIRRRNGQNDMAKVNFEKALSYPELGFNAHFYLGKIYGGEKNYAGAIEHLKSYIAKTDYDAGKREAQALIDRYMAANVAENSDTVRVDIADVAKNDMYREISDIPPETQYAPMDVRIDSLLSMAIVDTLTDAGQAMLKGVRAFSNDEMDQAIEAFKSVLVSYPRGDVAARSMYNIGICYIKLHDYRGAENQFQQIVDRYPTHVVAAKSMFLKALCYFERHESALSEQLFRRFIQNYRTHQWVGKAYEKLGDAYTDLEQPRKAVDAYSQAASGATSPTDKVYAFFKLGEAYQKVDNPTRAIQAFEDALATGDKNDVRERVPDACYKIADYYYQEKDYEKALEYYKRATRTHDWYHDTPWGLFQIGNIYKNLKKYDLAAKTYKDLIARYEGHYWAGQAKWKLEDAVWENEYKAVLR